MAVPLQLNLRKRKLNSHLCELNSLRELNSLTRAENSKFNLANAKALSINFAILRSKII